MERVDVVVAADVAAHAQAAQLGRCAVGALGVDVGHDDVGATTGERPARGPADPAATTGHDGDGAADLAHQ